MANWCLWDQVAKVCVTLQVHTQRINLVNHAGWDEFAILLLNGVEQ